jgi:hypothetical protein
MKHSIKNTPSHYSYYAHQKVVEKAASIALKLFYPHNQTDGWNDAQA